MDIAGAAGVSQSVVSAVFSTSPTILVNRETRQKVLDTAQRLGYKKRFVSANDWGRVRTKMVAWLDSPFYSAEGDRQPISSDFAAHEQNLLNSTITYLSRQGYSLVVKHLDADDAQIRDWLAHASVEAVIWRLGCQDSPLFNYIAAEFPTLVLNRSLARGVDRVSINQEENVSMPFSHLMELGHRKIGYFGQVPDSEVFSIRRNAYERLAREHGLPVYSEFLAIPDLQETPSPEKCRDILDCWASLGEKRPSAMIMSDTHAHHLLNEADIRGIGIPEDLSVIGIDNIGYCQVSKPALTSMHQPYGDMGRAAVELLTSRIEEPLRIPRMIMISPSLVQRSSVRNLTRREHRRNSREAHPAPESPAKLSSISPDPRSSAGGVYP